MLINPIFSVLTLLFHLDSSHLLSQRPWLVPDLVTAIENMSQKCRTVMQYEWSPLCAEAVMRLQKKWYNLDNSLNQEAMITGYEKMEHLFQTIAAFMTLKVRGVVQQSLDELSVIAGLYQKGL